MSCCLEKISVLSMPTHAMSMHQAVAAITHDIAQAHHGYVCLGNVHMCMEAYDSVEFTQILHQAQYLFADGRPIYWAQRLAGARHNQQIRGYDLMLALCEKAAADGIRVGLYGGSDQHLLFALHQQLLQRFPKLQIVYSYAPPFFASQLPMDENALAVMTQQRVQLLFVGLGCPKQERWMALHQPQSHIMMVGVGAAFDFLAGYKRHAPKWMQVTGLEWFFRLAAEPNRLIGRYFKHNPRFLLHYTRQWFRQIFTTKQSRRES